MIVDRTVAAHPAVPDSVAGAPKLSTRRGRRGAASACAKSTCACSPFTMAAV